MKIMNNTRQNLINSIHSMNKVLTYSYLEEQTDSVLLNLVHPLYREEFAFALKQEYKTSEDE